MSQWCRSALCGHPLPALTDNWTHGAASRHTIAPISHTRPSPQMLCVRGHYTTEKYTILVIKYIFLIAKQFKKCKYNAAVRKCTPMSNKTLYNGSLQWQYGNFDLSRKTKHKIKHKSIGHKLLRLSSMDPSPRSRSYYSFPATLRVGGWVGLSCAMSCH